MNQISKNPAYAHVKMSHTKLHNLSNNGHIKIHKNNRGYNYISLKELERVVQQEETEENNLITLNVLDTDEKYKHLYLNWNKTISLIESKQLELKITISGYKAITKSSLENYLNDSPIKTNLVTINKLLKEIKYTNNKFELISEKFLNYALNNGFEYEYDNKRHLINLDSLGSFVSIFKENWKTIEETVVKLNTTSELFNSFLKQNDIFKLNFSGVKYFNLSNTVAEFENWNRNKQKKAYETEMTKNLELQEQHQRQLNIKFYKEHRTLECALNEIKKKKINIFNVKICEALFNANKYNLIKRDNELHIKLTDIEDFVSSFVSIPFPNDKQQSFITRTNIHTILLKEFNLAYININSFRDYSNIFYYSHKEAINLLNVSETVFNNIKKEYIKKENFFYYPSYQTFYYNNTIINNLIEKQKKVSSEWISAVEAFEFINKRMLDYYAVKVNRIRRKEIPVFMRSYSPTGRYLYNKNDIQNVTQIIEMNRQLESLDIRNPVNILETGINEIYKLLFPTYAKKSEEMWFYYIKKQVLEINRSVHGTWSFIKQLISCTEIVIKAVENKQNEIINFSSNDMNIFFMGPEHIPKDYKLIFWKFIKELHSKLLILTMDSNKKPFNLKNVYKYSEIPIKKKREKNIYVFPQYLQLYDYANDISYHKQKAIDDARKNILEENCNRYDSIWLFMIVNLNNPWNHEEITLLPSIDLSKTKITNFDWLEKNDIELEDARTILFQYRMWDSKRLKTGIQQNFHISNELLGAFATAAAICQLRSNGERHPLLNRLIDFKTSGQRLKNTHKPYKAFFNNFDASFRYENIKLARSIISYKNVILTEYLEPGDESLKHDRGHSNMETTNIYIQLPKEHVDFLSKQLFSRDFLGNVYYNFSNLLYGETNNRTLQTERIIALKERFENVLSIESISGVLNELSKERNSVREIIYGLDTGSAAALYNKINYNSLPAKEKNYQCLSYPKSCIYPGRSCARCPIAIPNLLAIFRVVDDLMVTIKELKRLFNVGSVHEKTVLSNKIHQHLLDFGSCISQFSEKDEDEVYRLLSIERNEFISFLTTLPNFNQYITFHERMGI